jgi:hypothetical protein
MSEKFDRCLVKVRKQHRSPGKKHWALAARSICKKSCGLKKRKK